MELRAGWPRQLSFDDGRMCDNCWPSGIHNCHHCIAVGPRRTLDSKRNYHRYVGLSKPMYVVTDVRDCYHLEFFVLCFYFITSFPSLLQRHLGLVKVGVLMAHANGKQNANGPMYAQAAPHALVRGFWFNHPSP